MRRSVACVVVLAMVLLGGVTSRSEARPLRGFESSGPASVPGSMEVIYSNFGPDMAFDPNPNHGWTINGYQGPSIGRQAISQQFTPSGDYTFRSAQVAVSLYQGPNNLHVFLQADSSGLPGTVIEEISIGGLGYTPAVVSAQSALSPMLYKATPYWLTLVAEDDYVMAGWNWNSVGDASATTFAGTQGGSAAGPWSVGWLATRSAFQINGTPPTPQDAVHRLIEDVGGLLAEGLLTPDQADGLIDKLEAAIGSLNRGNAGAADHQLQAFVNQVNGFTKAGKLPPDKGQRLIDAAEAIRSQIG